MFSAMIPLVATLIALWFAVLLTRQYAARKRPHQLWWALSMLSYAFAAFGEFYALAFGWNVPMYKFYYFNAVSLVAVMAVGQMCMMFPKWAAATFAALNAAVMLAFAVLLLGVEPNLQVLAHSDAAVGGEALEKGSLIRSLFPPLLSAVGGMILIFGPFYSYWKTRFAGSLFIAGGAVILSAVGRLATLGYPEWLPIGELAGIVVIFYGVYGRMTSNNKGGTATHGNDGRQADH